jgi:hypothetical protein
MELFASTSNQLIYILAWNSKLSDQLFNQYDINDMETFLKELKIKRDSLDDKVYFSIAVLVQEKDKLIEMLKDEFGPQVLVDCSPSTTTLRLVITSKEAIRRANEIHEANFF